MRSGPDAPGWSERQALLLRAADEMHADGRIGDELWAQLAAQLDEVRLIELCMLIGHYEMLAMTLNSLGVEPERAQGSARLAECPSRASAAGAASSPAPPAASAAPPRSPPPARAPTST